MKTILLFIAVLFAAPAWAQSSATTTFDLRVAQWNVSVCKSNWAYYHVRHNPPLNPPGEQYYWPATISPDQLQAACIKWALKIYKSRVDTEEALIEGMTKHCCPNVKQPPATQPHYPGERKEYKSVQSEQEKMIEMFAAGMK